jgi:hypothetical protein
MIDLGEYLISADDRSVTLHRKTTVKNKQTGEETPAIARLGDYGTFAQAAARLAHIAAADAITAGKSVTQIVEAVNAAAAVILEALEPALERSAGVHPDQGQLPC